MKGIILHGSAGTRLRPLTDSGPKQLIPVANKPISQYALEDLISSGITQIAIVLGETFPELVREHFGNGSSFGAKITYIHQGRPLGIAHAISLCSEFIGKDKFVVYLGDNILQHGIRPYLEEFLEKNYDSMVLLKDVEDPRMFGVARFNKSGKLVELIEKPKEPPSNYALVGIYFFTPLIFRAIEKLKPSWRGEYEITDALQMLIDGGYRVAYKFVKGWWIDTGKKDDILSANALLDKHAVEKIDGEIINSKVENRVSVGKNTKVINSTIRGPSVLDENCYIKNSYIGSYTSIGCGTRIVDSSTEYCVILENVTIEGIDRIEESLIGKHAKIVRVGGRRAYRLNVADYSEVML